MRILKFRLIIYISREIEETCYQAPNFYCMRLEDPISIMYCIDSVLLGHTAKFQLVSNFFRVKTTTPIHGLYFGIYNETLNQVMSWFELKFIVLTNVSSFMVQSYCQSR